MKHIVILFLSILIHSTAGAQVSDNDIVTAMLGKNFYALNRTLDSLGIWYYHHFRENKSTSGQETKAKTYSIANSAGTVKVYLIHLHPEKKYITRVVINFRHDNRQHVEEISKMMVTSDYHVGSYSTDLIYKWKK